MLKEATRTTTKTQDIAYTKAPVQKAQSPWLLLGALAGLGALVLASGTAEPESPLTVDSDLEYETLNVVSTGTHVIGTCIATKTYQIDQGGPAYNLLAIHLYDSVTKEAHKLSMFFRKAGTRVAFRFRKATDPVDKNGVFPLDTMFEESGISGWPDTVGHERAWAIRRDDQAIYGDNLYGLQRFLADVYLPDFPVFKQHAGLIAEQSVKLLKSKYGEV